MERLKEVEMLLAYLDDQLSVVLVDAVEGEGLRHVSHEVTAWSGQPPGLAAFAMAPFTSMTCAP